MVLRAPPAPLVRAAGQPPGSVGRARGNGPLARYGAILDGVGARGPPPLAAGADHAPGRHGGAAGGPLGGERAGTKRGGPRSGAARGLQHVDTKHGTARPAVRFLTRVLATMKRTQE